MSPPQKKFLLQRQTGLLVEVDPENILTSSSTNLKGIKEAVLKATLAIKFMNIFLF